MKQKPNNRFSKLFWENITLWRTGEAGNWDGAPMGFRRTALDAADYLQATTFMSDKLALVGLIMEISTDEQVCSAAVALNEILRPKPLGKSLIDTLKEKAQVNHDAET